MTSRLWQRLCHFVIPPKFFGRGSAGILPAFFRGNRNHFNNSLPQNKKAIIALDDG
jgi:hypothetical protein